MTILNKKVSVTTLVMALVSTGVLAAGFDRLPGSESPQMRRFREAPVVTPSADLYRSFGPDDMRYTDRSDSPRREREEGMNRQKHSAQSETPRVSAEPGILAKIGEMVVSFFKSIFVR